MKKVIDYVSFSQRMGSLMQEIEADLVEAMKSQNVKVISLINNGDHSGFDVDKTYASIEDENTDIVIKEVILIMAEGRNIFIATENEIPYLDFDKITLSGDVYSPESWERLSNNLKCKDPFILINDMTYTPQSTMIELAATLKEVLEVCMEGRVLNNGETISLS